MSSNVSSNRTITTTALKNALRRCIQVKRPVFLWGPPGIGKSDVVNSLCEEMGGLMCDIRLSQMEPTDIRGLPYYNKEENAMSWAPPIELPSQKTASEYPIVFLFLDEMNSAPTSVQAACYQLILSRRLGVYKLPDNVVVIAAGNREGDRGIAFRQPAPLANRFVHFELRVDFDSWEEWAVKHRINRDIVGFLNFSKNSLYDFDPNSPAKSFATPRSWEFVSHLLDDDTEDTTMTDIIAGTIGEGLALKFLAHRRIASNLPKPRNILDGSVTTLKTKEISAQYSLGVSLCYELDDLCKKIYDTEPILWGQAANNFLAFIMENFTTEIGVMTARMALKVYQLPFVACKLENFNKFFNKFGKLILLSATR